MAASSPTKKTIEIQANATTPRGATIKLTVEYRIRPTASTHSGPIQEVLSMQRSVNVDMGTSGQRTQEATYQHFGETDNNNYHRTQHSSIERIPEATQVHVQPILPTEDTVLVSERIIEHISEDEKSITSEEVVFEEWSEEFQCRCTEEYDCNTNKLLRTTIDETSDRIKGDVIKEEYKEKNVRIKGHKSYDVVKEVYRRVPANTIESTTHRHEEIPQPPPSTQVTTLSSTIDQIHPYPQDRHWTSEDTYTTEIVYDSNVARDIESSNHAERVDTKHDSSSFTNYDRVHSGQYPSMPPTTQTTIPLHSSSNYERVSTTVTPTVHYAEKRNQSEEEQMVSEEYQVEIEQYDPTKKREETSEEDGSDNYNTIGSSHRGYSTETDQQSSTRRDLAWKNKLREIYAPPSDDDQFDQHEKRMNGHYTAQRVSVMPPNIQQREVKTSAPSRYTAVEARVSTSRGSSPEKQYHYSSLDDTEQKRKTVVFGDSDRSTETLKKVSSISPTDDDRQHALKHSSSSSSSIIDERRAKFEQQHQNETTSHSLSIHKTDRPSFGRVGEMKNVFETTTTTTSGSAKDDTSKYKIPITVGSTEQRRRIFEEQEQTNKEWTPTTRRPINEFRSDEHRMSETHTTPHRVTDRISRIEGAESKSTSRIQPTDRLGRTGFDTVRSALESSLMKTTPQSSLDIKIQNKQIISSIDSDLSGPSHPIYQSTPKSTKQKYDEDAGHESEDESSDPIITIEHEQNYDNRRRTLKTRLRDFSQSTSQPLETSQNVQRTISRFNESNMENILSHVPSSKGKGILIELSPRKSQSPTKSNLVSDSGIYEYSTGTSQYPPTSSSSWHNNASTSIIDDTSRIRNNDSVPITSSYYGHRQASDTDQTITQNVDDSLARSTYRYDTELVHNEPINQQQRTVRRQITSSIPTDYESLTNYRSGINSQGKIPITTQSRTVKPFVVDEVETIETETRVECQVDRTNESTTKTDQSTSPMSSPKKILTTRSRSPYSSANELTTSKRVLLNDRPQYYDSTRNIEEPVYRHSSTPRSNIRTYETDRRTMEVTSLSPQNQILFGKNSPNEIIAVVRVPELGDRAGLRTSSSSTVRHGISEPELYAKAKQQQQQQQQQEEDRSRLQYQRIYASSYCPPSLTQDDEQQRQSRYRAKSSGPLETANNYSSPVAFPTRSASYHSTLHDQGKQQHSYSPHTRLTTYRPQTQHYTGSLGNLYGSNIDFEIEIEKRPPHHIEQPTVVSLDQGTRAVITTSKDGRVSVQNVAARPGNTVVINSDFHSSDRSLNRSSGYFSADEHRSLGLNTNYSSDEQSTGANQNSIYNSSHTRHDKTNESTNSQLPSYYRSQQSYQKPSDNFHEVDEIVRQYYQPSTNSTGFNETINQIDALYNNLDVQRNNQTSSSSIPYNISKSPSKTNRRKQLLQNSNEYSNRYTSTGFQHIPTEQQQSTTNLDFQTDDNANRNWTSASSLNNLVLATPIRPSHPLSSSGILTDYTTPGFGLTQNTIVQQNRLNGQSQLVQRNRTSVKQVKQKSAAKRRNGNIQGQYSEEEDDNDSPLSDTGNQSPSRSYNFTNRYQ